MVHLTPMTQPDFEDFLESDIRQYAAERTEAGYWSEAEAMPRSRTEHEVLLPQGLATKDHYIYTIRERETGAAAGVIWLKVSLDSSRPSGFIFDLEIYEQFRRKGYARQAMLQLEEVARGLGLQQLGLHVFAHNANARALYESLGYAVASLNLLKPLPPPIDTIGPTTQPGADIHARLCALLDREGAEYRLVEHTPEGRTELIAKIRGNRLEQAIKSIVVQIRINKKKNSYCLANVPGDCSVDLERIRAHFDAAGTAVASREKAEGLTGCVIGAIPPYAFDDRLSVLADPLILENEEVVFNAGRLDRSIFMRSADYIRTAKPQLTSIAIRP